jgi:F-type H+-transporting ATPase subunit b
MEAITSLGIDAKLLIAQIINFLILLFLLSKFLYKPIVAMLDKRSETIKKSLDDAKKIEEDLKNTEVRTTECLGKAQEEAKKIVADAKKSADEEAKKMIAQAEKRAAEISDKAKAEVAEEKDKAKKEIRQEVATLVAMATEKIIGKEVDAVKDEKLVKEIIGQIE